MLGKLLKACFYNKAELTEMGGNPSEAETMRKCEPGKVTRRQTLPWSPS